MAITAAERDEIIGLVVAANNAPPGVTLLSSLVVDANAGASMNDIAVTLTNSDYFKATYPVFQTAAEFAAEFLGNLTPDASAELIAEAACSKRESVSSEAGSTEIISASPWMAPWSSTVNIWASLCFSYEASALSITSASS